MDRFVSGVELIFFEEDSRKPIGTVKSDIGLAVPIAGDVVDVPTNNEASDFIRVEVRSRHFRMTPGRVTVQIACQILRPKD